MDKKRILFVDDDPNVIQGLQRMLRGMRNEWDMSFAGSGAEALQQMDTAPFDVLVTDMRMPGMTGEELLAEVRKRHPSVLRIVLSGQVEQESLLRSVELTHQFIAKPADADTLKSVISRSTALHRILESEQLKQIVSGMESLPSLPSLYVEIMNELRSESGSMARVGEIISRDIAMSAKILQLVNSAFFGLPRKVANPTQAAIYLGMDTIRALVLSMNIFSRFPEEKLGELGLERIWQHSILTAVIAKRIARDEAAEQSAVDFAFMGGLLHDAGKLVLAFNLPEEYTGAMQLVGKEAASAAEAERIAFKVTHAEIGAYLLAIWGLQDPLVEAVCFHHEPSRCPNPKFSPLTAVHAANALQHELEVGTPGVDKKYIESIGKTPRLDGWRRSCRELVQKGEQNE